MRNMFYAAIAACLAMLATSGIVALATAASTTPSAVEFDFENDAAMEDMISAYIDAQYREVLERQAATRH